MLLTKKLLVGAAAGLALMASSTVFAEVKIRVQSVLPTKADEIVMLKDFAANVAQLTNNEVQIEVLPDGAVVSGRDIMQAVDKGLVEAGFAWTHYWSGIHPAAMLFGSPVAGAGVGIDNIAFISWFMYGGGKELFEEIYARHNIRGILCGVIPPEASGWFRQPIESVDDLQGLKMRFFGLGAKVMDRVGASTQLLAGGDIFPALELGTIDATEFSMPAIDLNLGFYQVAKHYYFPGWHQQSTNFELMINMDRWNGISPLRQTQIETVCGDNFRHSIAEGETIQIAALEELQRKGVTIHTWPEAMLATFRSAWEEVVAEEVAADADFARVWESLTTFRERYKLWRDLGYL